MYGYARTGKIRNFALHLERLEDRYLMNGDPAPVTALVGDDSETVATATDAAATTAESQTNFGLPDWFLQQIDQRYSQLFGTSTPFGAGSVLSLSNFTAGYGSAFDRMNDMDFEDPTNVQVVGVDEADLVESDGKYLYYISRNELFIVDASNPTDLSLTSRFRLPDAPTGMYLSEGRLTLVSSRYKNFSFGGGRLSIARTVTEVTVLDVTEQARPRVVQSSEYSGHLVSSRMVDGNLRLVTQQDKLSFVDFLLPLEQHASGKNDEQGRPIFAYESRNDYLERISESYLEAILPYASTYSPEGELLSRESFLTPGDLSGLHSQREFCVTTVVSIDTHGNSTRPEDVKVLLTGRAAHIYGTAESVYLFGNPLRAASSDETTIWKLDFVNDNRAIRLAAMGTVPGFVLNQFSLDESRGFLRVVSSDASGQQGTDLSILKQVGGKLKIVGSIADLAPGEQLRSVRFLGDRLFAVTFKQVDPLFAIDLSNPHDPRVVGSLKLPGFSDYMQPIDENRILAVGRAVDEATGVLAELEVSIFDVSDLHNPRLAHRYTIADSHGANSIVTSGGWSAGVGDHHAFRYFAAESLMALSVNGSNGPDGLHVFHVDLARGFTLRSIIKHNAPILRSLKIGEGLFAVSSESISVHSFEDPDQEWDRLNLRDQIMVPSLPVVNVPPSQPLSPPTEQAPPTMPEMTLPNEMPPAVGEIPYETIGEITIPSPIRVFPNPSFGIIDISFRFPEMTVWTGESVLLPGNAIDVIYATDWEVMEFGSRSESEEMSLIMLSLGSDINSSPLQTNDFVAQDFDYLFAEQSHPHFSAPQRTSSRDRAFDSFFVPVSRSVRAAAEDVAGELADSGGFGRGGLGGAFPPLRQ